MSMDEKSIETAPKVMEWPSWATWAAVLVALSAIATVAATINDIW